MESIQQRATACACLSCDVFSCFTLQEVEWALPQNQKAVACRGKGVEGERGGGVSPSGGGRLERYQ